MWHPSSSEYAAIRATLPRAIGAASHDAAMRQIQLNVASAARGELSAADALAAIGAIATATLHQQANRRATLPGFAPPPQAQAHATTVLDTHAAKARSVGAYSSVDSEWQATRKDRR